ALLALVLAAAVLVARLADLVALEEDDLSAALARVDLGRQRCRVAEFQRHVPLPLGLERRDVDDDSAARIGTLAEADRQHVSWNAEVLERAGQGEAVGRNHADIGVDIDEAFLVEVLRIDDGREDVREDLEFGRAADVVAVARGAVAEDAMAVGGMAHLPGLEGLDHPCLPGHAADPLVTLYAHAEAPHESARIVGSRRAPGRAVAHAGRRAAAHESCKLA